VLQATLRHAEADWPQSIDTGDEIVVAGKMDKGTFDAKALRNLTKGTLDCKQWRGGGVTGVIVLAIGIGILLWCLGWSRSTDVEYLVGLLFGASGIGIIWHSNHLRIAEELVRAAHSAFRPNDK
jgi:hypothetical protein